MSSKRRRDIAVEMDQDLSDEDLIPPSKRLTTRAPVEHSNQHFSLKSHGLEDSQGPSFLNEDTLSRTPTPETSCLPSDSGISSSSRESLSPFPHPAENDEQMDTVEYNPEFDESRNPFYYNSNRLLYEARLERIRRGKHF